MTTRERHVMLALGLLMEQARELVVNDPAIALRPSQLRVVGMVPEDGITVTDLADRVGMTKQGIGQFVGQLVDDGYLTVEVHPEDRRVRVVRRTPLGEQASRQLGLVLADLETRWAQRIGTRNYRQFRAVLDRLADLPPD
jgi:DNA-binding MarR family transcriptional regulator